MKTKLLQLPIFDVDDLGFFRDQGLALRHTSLQEGLREATKGKLSHGDAVSLANFGYPNTINPEDDEPFEFTIETCRRFHVEVEQFIEESFIRFHLPKLRYQDAAFLVVDKGYQARIPYDFKIYPLGKCGGNGFTSQQVLCLVRTDSHTHEDLIHAKHNTLLQLRQLLRELKLRKACEWLDSSDATSPIRPALEKLIEYYRENIFLYKPFFSQLKAFGNDTPNTELMNLLHQLNDDKHYTPPLPSLNTGSLFEKLIVYARDQNEEKVREFLSSLREQSLDAKCLAFMRKAMIEAAVRPNTNILKLIYEFKPSVYDGFFSQDNSPTPIFAAAKHSCFNNLKYLFSKRALDPREHVYKLSDKNKRHILCGPTVFQSPDNIAVIELLLSHHVGLGNESMDPFEHPLSAMMLSYLRNDILHLKNDIVKLLLPHASSLSKYLAIAGFSNELYSCYGHGFRQLKDYTNSLFGERINCLSELRRQILRSITPNEYGPMREYFASSEFPILRGEIKAVMQNDLLEFEAPACEPAYPALENIIRQCFSMNLEPQIAPFRQARHVAMYSPPEKEQENSRHDEAELHNSTSSEDLESLEVDQNGLCIIL